MAILVNNSSGNFTSAATWSVIDPTGFPTLQATQEIGTTNTTTTFVSSTNITPGAITIDGIGLKISSRNGSPSGTFSVRLFNSTGAAAVAGTTVTVNVADLSAGISWHFFKFTAPVTLSAATAYNVQLVSSVNAQVTIFRKSATASDWTYFLRTTTNAAPAATDQLLICGEWTGQSSNQTFTVTMNNTTNTVFGAATSGAMGIEINAKGVLSYGTAAATNYQLRLAGTLLVNQDGTFNIGTSGNPIPSNSTAALEFVVASNVQFGLNIRNTYNGVFNAYGSPKIGRAYLSSNVSAGSTAITTDVSTNWNAGDQIAIASTSRTVAETELVTASGNASGTIVPVSALSFNHLGTSPTVAEVINLTRNVKIFGQSATLQTYILIGTLTTVNMQYVEMYFMGSATGNNRGVDILTTTGSCSIVGCAFRNFEVNSSIGINTSTTTANTSINDCVFYRIANQAINTSASSTTTLSITNCWALSNITAGQVLISFSSISGTFTGITAVSATNNGISIVGNDLTNITYSDLTCHSNGATGITCGATSTTTTAYTLQNISVWRNNTRGLFMSGAVNFIVDTVNAFGNLTDGVEIGASFNALLRNMTINAGTVLLQPIGVIFSSNNTDITIDNSSIGTTQTHATSDVQTTTTRSYTAATFRNCSFGSSTLISGQTNMLPDAYVGFSRLNGVAGTHRLYRKYGLIAADSSFFVIQSPSQRLTPNTANQKLISGLKKVAVPSGKSVKITAYVRKSVAGDGTAYNGNQPRLILIADPATGISTDTVLATSTVAGNGAFEVLQGTSTPVTDDVVLRFYVDCDGTAGWINVDRWSVEII